MYVFDKLTSSDLVACSCICHRSMTLHRRFYGLDELKDLLTWVKSHMTTESVKYGYLTKPRLRVAADRFGVGHKEKMSLFAMPQHFPGKQNVTQQSECHQAIVLPASAVEQVDESNDETLRHGVSVHFPTSESNELAHMSANTEDGKSEGVANFSQLQRPTGESNQPAHVSVTIEDVNKNDDVAKLAPSKPVIDNDTNMDNHERHVCDANRNADHEMQLANSVAAAPTERAVLQAPCEMRTETLLASAIEDEGTTVNYCETENVLSKIGPIPHGERSERSNNDQSDEVEEGNVGVIV